MTRHSTWLGLATSALIAATFSIQVGAVPADADSRLSPPVKGVKSPAYEQWRKSMLRDTTRERGCYRADYPEKEWKQVPCTTAPLRPYVRRDTAGPGAEVVGDLVDYSAELPGGGLIAYGEGSFGTSAITGESQGSVANSFSLQLNTNFFSTSVCNGASNCWGWQQYVFSNPYTGNGAAFIQYWIFNYPSGCPSGFSYYPGNPGAAGCYMNSAAVSVPGQPIDNLSALALTGTAVSGGLDQLNLSTGTGLYSTYGEDTVLYASDGWTQAEFNVFGDGGGSQATFSSGTLISVETLVTNGATTSAPTYTETGTTGETNNLTLGSLVCPVADPNGPYIWFQESYGATPATSCPPTPISLAAPTVTGTETTVAGTGLERFTFTWPSVSGATYYLVTRSGAESTLTADTVTEGLGCGQTAVVTLASCDAAGCGWPETILNAKNTHVCE